MSELPTTRLTIGESRARYGVVSCKGNKQVSNSDAPVAEKGQASGAESNKVWSSSLQET